MFLQALPNFVKERLNKRLQWHCTRPVLETQPGGLEGLAPVIFEQSNC